MEKKIICSGKFLARNYPARISVRYSIGYTYSPTLHGVYVQLLDEDHKRMSLQMTPDQAEDFAKCLVEWAALTRKYQQVQ